MVLQMEIKQLSEILGEKEAAKIQLLLSKSIVPKKQLTTKIVRERKKSENKTRKLAAYILKKNSVPLSELPVEKLKVFMKCVENMQEAIENIDLGSFFPDDVGELFKK